MRDFHRHCVAEPKRNDFANRLHYGIQLVRGVRFSFGRERDFSSNTITLGGSGADFDRLGPQHIACAIDLRAGRRRGLGFGDIHGLNVQAACDTNTSYRWKYERPPEGGLKVPRSEVAGAGFELATFGL